MTSIELAEAVGLSPSSCQRRQRELEQRGVIRGYHADVDPAVLGQSLAVFAADAAATPRSQRRSKLSEGCPSRLPEVLEEVHHIAGAFDYLLRIAVADRESDETFLADRLSALTGVSNITSYVGDARRCSQPGKVDRPTCLGKSPVSRPKMALRKRPRLYMKAASLRPAGG